MTDDERTGRRDPKVAELLARKPEEALDEVDAVTAAELARWFGLPSVTEVLERGDVAVAAEPSDADPDGRIDVSGLAHNDPERRAEQARRAADALAAVDLGIIDRIVAFASREVRHFHLKLALHVEREIARFDASMAKRGLAAEPREAEISPEIADAITECTPQALLRDLHRPDTEFEKSLEVSEDAARLIVDGQRVVREALADRRQPPPPVWGDRHQASAEIARIRAERRAPWSEIRTANRRPEIDAEEASPGATPP
jgi:hypothetical protein